MTTPKRIYLVRSPIDGTERLVRAANQSQARAHCARELEVSVASQDQIVALLTLEQPIAVEDAGAEPVGAASE
jgi:hypothetical protein